MRGPTHHRQLVKNRDLAAGSFLQRIWGGIDLCEDARRALDGANDGLNVWVPFGGGVDSIGVLGKHLLERRIGGGG